MTRDEIIKSATTKFARGWHYTPIVIDFALEMVRRHNEELVAELMEFKPRPRGLDLAIQIIVESKP